MNRSGPDRTAIAAALTYHDPSLAHLAHTSATFALGLDQIVDVACAAVTGLAALAADLDDQQEQAIAAALVADPNLIGRTRFGSGAP